MGATFGQLDIMGAWNYGITTAWDIPLWGKPLKINAEYHYTHFNNQMVIDLDSDPLIVSIHDLDGKSRSHTWQVDVSYPVFEGLELTVAYRYNDDEAKFQAGRMALTPIDHDTLDFLAGQDIVKLLYQNTDIPYLEQIERELADVTGDLDVSYSSNRYLEFNPRGVTKGAGLLRLAELLGVDPKDTIAIGDNWNDFSMIQAAGVGAAVANAVESMKPQCDYVCAATCDENAVAEVIRTFVL